MGGRVTKKKRSKRSEETNLNVQKRKVNQYQNAMLPHNNFCRGHERNKFWGAGLTKTRDKREKKGGRGEKGKKKGKGGQD